MSTKPDSRPRGRPKVDPQDRSVYVCVTVSSKQYDSLYQRAKQERAKSVPELIRRVLGSQLGK